VETNQRIMCACVKCDSSKLCVLVLHVTVVNYVCLCSMWQ